MKLFLAITVLFYVLDQVTKALVLKYIGEDEHIPVIPGFFNLVQVHNDGMPRAVCCRTTTRSSWRCSLVR